MKIGGEDLARVYGAQSARVSALAGVSLRIADGEFAAIIGRSGSGKSTLMNLVGLLDTPTSGALYLDDVNTTDLTGDERAAIRNRDIGFVFQSYHLLPRYSVEENVGLPLLYRKARRGDIRKRVLEALDHVGLAHRFRSRPTELSGGEQQRVAIARAIVGEPSIILADEPTGALDKDTGREVLDVLAALNRRGRTILLVTHDPDVASRASHIVTMEDGLIKSDSYQRPARVHDDPQFHQEQRVLAS